MPEDRAVSEVLGYALVFSLVITTVAIVTTGGLGQLQDARDAEQLNNAERAFDLLATNIEDLTKRGAPSRSTEIRPTGAQLDVADPITVSFRGIDDDTPSNNFSESYDVWPIIYRSTTSDATLVYSGGAVFRSQGDNGIAVRDPPIVADNGRVVVPLVHTRTRDVQSISGGTARIRTLRSGVDLLVSDTDDTYDRVFVNITSERAKLWNDTLADYDAFDCRLNTTTTPNRADCKVTDPTRVHISLVNVDVELAD